jgi:hypothetical protein
MFSMLVDCLSRPLLLLAGGATIGGGGDWRYSWGVVHDMGDMQAAAAAAAAAARCAANLFTRAKGSCTHTHTFLAPNVTICQ